MSQPFTRSLTHSNICSFTSSIISSLNHWPSHLRAHLFIPPCALTKGHRSLNQGLWEYDQCLITGHVTSQSDTLCYFFWGEKQLKNKNKRIEGTMLVLSSQSENSTLSSTVSS